MNIAASSSLEFEVHDRLRPFPSFVFNYYEVVCIIQHTMGGGVTKRFCGRRLIISQPILVFFLLVLHNFFSFLPYDPKSPIFSKLSHLCGDRVWGRDHSRLVC